MKMNRLPFLSSLKPCLLGLVAACGLWSGAAALGETPSLICVDNFTHPGPFDFDFVLYPQHLDAQIVVLTAPHFDTGDHWVTVADDGDNVESYDFNVADDDYGTITGGSVSNFTEIKDSKGNFLYSSAIIGIFDFSGDNFPTSMWPDLDTGGIVPAGPNYDYLYFKLDYAPSGWTATADNTKLATVMSVYDYTDWGIINILGFECPFVPGASAASPTTTQVTFDLRKIKQNPNAPYLDCNGHCTSCPDHGMAVASLDRFQAGIAITDTPVSYSPPVGMAMNFTISYHQRLNNEPATVNYSNLGPQWQVPLGFLYRWRARPAGRATPPIIRPMEAIIPLAATCKPSRRALGRR